MTIDVTDDYVLGPSQSLSDTTDGMGFYLSSAAIGAPDPTLTIEGSFLLSADIAGVVDGVVNSIYNSSYVNSYFEVAASGSFSVTDTAAGSSVVVFSANSFSASIENNGNISANAPEGATGVWAYQFDGQGKQFPADVVNNGTFSVSSGDFSVGIRLQDGASIINAGSLSVTGSSAYGIYLEMQSPSTGFSTIQNSGDLDVTSIGGQPSVGIYINAGQAWNQSTTIDNSGTITAGLAISEPSQGDAPPMPSIHLSNSGTINGEIMLGSAQSAGNPSQPPTEIDNSGQINGAIHFGDDDVIYSGASGTQTGGIYLGAGTATVILGNDGETVHGASGNAIVTSGAGNDTIIGGTGTTTVSYASATSGVTVNLGLTTPQNTGSGGTDTLQNIQGVIGSNYNDVFIAGSGQESFNGGGGYNTVELNSIHQSQATLAHQSNGSWLLTAGGVTDTLTNIQAVQFADGSVTLGHYTPVAELSDFTGAGQSGILWLNTNGDVSTWNVTGSNTLQFQEDATYNTAPGNGWQLVGTMDATGDGQSDIVWHNSKSSQAALWHETSPGSFSPSYLSSNIDTTWTIGALGDFNGDGKDDMLWRKADGTVSEWTSNGSGFAINTFTDHVSTSWHIQGVGDFNGDGKQDILWRNDDGALSIWSGTATGFAENTYYQGPVSSDWHIAGIGDFNGDGKADILWWNNDGAVSVWTSAGNGFYENTYYNTVGSGWSVAGIFDFNGDGKADILWHNTNGLFSIWDSTGSAFTIPFTGSVDPSWAPFAMHYDIV